MMTEDQHWRRIERVFHVMLTRYGSAWDTKYVGADIDDVKRDWIRLLTPFSTQTISSAMERLPADRPPNGAQFRDLCAAVEVRPETARVAGPRPDRARMAAVLAHVASRITQQDPRAWIGRLEERIAAGETLSPAQLVMLQRARGESVPGDSDDGVLRDVGDRQRETQRAVQTYAAERGIPTTTT